MKSQISLSLALAFAALLAGCIDAPEAVDGATLDDPVFPTSPPVEPTLVSFDGDFGIGMFACPAVTCVSEFPAYPQRFDTHEDMEGAVDVRLSATWDAATPLYEELILGVFSCTTDCNGDAQVSAFEYVVGASGVALDLDRFEVADGEVLWVYMQVPALTPSPAYTALYLPQEFHVEGTLTPRS